ncbi:hypothetical protein Thivi_4377 [Thiocystis violascens DSM 198]|uniref:Uncharacterized protein n=1 Tax=Thiocystis violascens (strain ATCC 17096 / DSM 198 / 6111) TaxID=765911 RepID=I3YGR4_THIV6|nr:hypothetical protein Thivi_4377 [Thiocystis violascens DSM 198]
MLGNESDAGQYQRSRPGGGVGGAAMSGRTGKTTPRHNEGPPVAEAGEPSRRDANPRYLLIEPSPEALEAPPR